MKNLSILIKSKISDDKNFFYAIYIKSTRGSLTLLVGNLANTSIEEKAPFFLKKNKLECFNHLLTVNLK